MTIKQNIADIHDRLQKEASRYGYLNPILIAVSKMQPAERIKEALDAGQRVFGENRVQEAQTRWQDLKLVHPDIALHLIGPLQTNKAKDAVTLFDVIHTVDRPKLAHALATEMKKQNRMLECFIQVNTGDEDQKAGVAVQDLADLLNISRDECGLNITGLMCIPPVNEPPALHFALLKKLAAQHGLSNLSMGMSGDYEKAAALGATHVRIGSGVFGERPI
jgi:pyridoxal phosphate enzyme (YggS family)